MHRRTMTWAASGALALGVLLGGCATTPPEEPMTTATPEPRPTSPGKTPPSHPTILPSAPAAPPPVDPPPADVLEQPGVRAAVDAEAHRRNVDPDAVEVVSLTEVTWSDGSIGCPRPGMVYTQALVPGRLLVLKVGDQRASYHAGGRAEFAYCPSPQSPLPGEANPSR